MPLFMIWIGFCLLVGLLAIGRGRSGWAWGLGSIFISPLLGGLFVLVMPNLKIEAAKAAAEAKARAEEDAMQQRLEFEAEHSKTCPRCAETVKKAALVCRFCGHEFAEETSTGMPAGAAPAE